MKCIHGKWNNFSTILHQLTQILSCFFMFDQSSSFPKLLSLKCTNSPVCVYRNSVILCKLGDRVSTLSLPAASLTPSFLWDDFALQIRHSGSQINIIYFIRYSPKYRQCTQSQENGPPS